MVSGWKVNIWQKNAFGCVVPKGCQQWIQDKPSQTVEAEPNADFLLDGVWIVFS